MSQVDGEPWSLLQWRQWYMWFGRDTEGGEPPRYVNDTMCHIVTGQTVTISVTAMHQSSGEDRIGGVAAGGETGTLIAYLMETNRVQIHGALHNQLRGIVKN